MVQATIDVTVAGLQGNPVSPNSPAVGQMLVWNGTAWVPSGIINGPLTVQGNLSAPSLSGNMTATGNLTGANVAATGVCEAAQFQTPNGVNILTGRATAQRTVVLTQNLTAVAVMAGMNLQLAPKTSGVFLILVSANANSPNNSNNNFNLQMVYGQGTPPVTGQGVTGTPLGTAFGTQISTPNQNASVTNFAIIAGLAVGAIYWFDFAAMLANSGVLGTSTILVVEL